VIVHVVGAGLIGTSIGLALRDVARVHLSDGSQEHLAVAVERGAGVRWDGTTRADLLVACVPPRAVAEVLRSGTADGLAGAYTHVASVQVQVQQALDDAGVDASLVCGGHPLAGRERGGPAAATARLFVDRPWVLCPSPVTTVAVQDVVREVVLACGAVPVEADPRSHDRAVALVSHLPQVAASAVAARLLAADPDVRPAPSALAGPGVQDTTRIAASDPALWVEVLAGNAAQVAPLVRALADDLAEVAGALDALAVHPGDAAAQAVVRSLLGRGNEGRSRLPAKQRTADLVPVVVAVLDRPGQLAGLLATASQAGVNVEDLRVEHLPGRPRGLVELQVTAGEADRAARALADAGWDVLDRG
jgi:prephenate dehydrogenase